MRILTSSYPYPNNIGQFLAFIDRRHLIMNKTIAKYPFSVNVLGFKEDGEWCALGLEVDIRGYGHTFEEACSDLTDLITSQISFSMYKDQVELIFHSADDKFFDIFNTIKHKQQHKVNDDTKRYRSSKVSLREIIAKITSNPQEFADYQRLNVEHGENVLR